MTEWLGLILDVILIAVVGVGIFQVVTLIRQLRDLRAGRQEMDRFVRDFNGAVIRAEAGIKALRSAARESGDDLEKLVEKAVMVRDELTFIVGSADGVAERLSVSASKALTGEKKTQAKTEAAPVVEDRPYVAPESAAQPKADDSPAPSRAEKELLQALQKMRGGIS